MWTLVTVIVAARDGRGASSQLTRQSLSNASFKDHQLLHPRKRTSHHNNALSNIYIHSYQYTRTHRHSLPAALHRCAHLRLLLYCVVYLNCHGVVSGYADNTYRPGNRLTRAQFTKMLVLAFNVPFYTPPPPEHTFGDVPRDHPFFLYIESYWHYVNGNCFEGCDTFGPNSSITRGQACKTLVLVANWPIINPPTPTFSDVPTDHPFYVYIETAYCHGIISGYDNGVFLPGNSLNRGQAAKIVYKAITGTIVCGTSPTK